ncbi:hypothetical protein ACLOJK_021309 [Asimina triloba]
MRSEHLRIEEGQKALHCQQYLQGSMNCYYSQCSSYQLLHPQIEDYVYECHDGVDQDSSIFNDITNLSPIRPCNESSSHLPLLDYVFGSPRQNSQRGSNFTQRPQKPGSADAEQSLKENARPKILSATQGVSGPSISQLAVQSIPCTHDHDSKVPTVVQPYSSSEGISELLADPLKGFDHFTQSPNLLSSEPSKISQNNIRGTTAEVLVDDNVKKDMENELAPTKTLPKEVEDVPKGKESCILGNPTAKGDGESSGRQADENVTYLITANLSTQPASGKQHVLHSVDQAATTTALLMTNTEPGIVKHEEQKSFSSSGFHQLGIEDNLQVKKSTQLGDCDHTPELLPETFESVQFHDVHNENERAMNNQTMEYHMHNECKVTWMPKLHKEANCGLNVQLTGKDYLSLPWEKSPSASIRHLSEDLMGQLAPVNLFGNSLDKSTAKSESSLAYSVRINIEVDQDEIFATRQHIESRNPLAFAPKIVRRVADSLQSSRVETSCIVVFQRGFGSRLAGRQWVRMKIRLSDQPI